ncbi:hypothetical protein [Oxynema aestuarii]|uniref:Uncharacterized protein n=1 Tax=Oxynema aestuarii AP17 TaxID=2064643 RepID=A0A6H1TS22_9CYAN|nr:hypothetical protein [Oxynema aestuarii]QIZ69341.1 hypothetical protein HCG48_01010 [Oxynema aestuarii AP17]RMH74126.1 MAG: hypothetical protein D6680_15330 [Cyanobacteria bacterium J007]
MEVRKSSYSFPHGFDRISRVEVVQTFVKTIANLPTRSSFEAIARGLATAQLKDAQSCKMLAQLLTSIIIDLLWILKEYPRDRAVFKNHQYFLNKITK